MDKRTIRIPVVERMLTKFDIDWGTVCWNWTASTNGRYGVIRTPDRGGQVAHRVMWEETVGLVPEGLELDHLCKNKLCVNPDHLEPVTRAENIRRGTAHDKAREYFAAITHCRYGHEYDEANTAYYTSEGYRKRHCRACSRRRSREAVARKAALDLTR